MTNNKTINQVTFISQQDIINKVIRQSSCFSITKETLEE